MLLCIWLLENAGGAFREMYHGEMISGCYQSTVVYRLDAMRGIISDVYEYPQFGTKTSDVLDLIT